MAQEPHCLPVLNDKEWCSTLSWGSFGVHQHGISDPVKNILILFISFISENWIHHFATAFLTVASCKTCKQDTWDWLFLESCSNTWGQKSSGDVSQRACVFQSHWTKGPSLHTSVDWLLHMPHGEALLVDCWMSPVLVLLCVHGVVVGWVGWSWIESLIMRRSWSQSQSWSWCSRVCFLQQWKQGSWSGIFLPFLQWVIDVLGRLDDLKVLMPFLS